MKSVDTRNFETGILSSDPVLLDGAISQFDSVWIGRFCNKCKRKKYCGDRIK
ncbi:MAG: hypothetical protein ACK5KL_15955 [Dysgonomonas sp.]